MPIDPNIANPKMFQIPDAMDSMGKALTNALMIERMRGLGDERASRNALSAAYRSNLKTDGTYDRAGVLRHIADNNFGYAIPDAQRAWYDLDKTQAETTHKMAEAEGIDGRTVEQEMKNIEGMMRTISADPKQGPAQYQQVLKMMASGPVMTKYLAAHSVTPEQFLERTNAQLQQAVGAGQWPQFYARLVLSPEQASKQKITEINRGNTVDLVATPEHSFGAVPPKTIYQGKVGVNPNTLVREGGQNARTAASLANQNQMQGQRLAHQDVMQNRLFGHQDEMQGGRFGQQDKVQDKNIAAQKAAAEQRARLAREAAERKIAEKKEQNQVLASNLFAREVARDYPNFRVHGVEGDDARIKLNLLPPIRGGPDHYEIRKIKELANQRGFRFVQGDLGQPSYIVPMPGADPNSLRPFVANKKPQYTYSRDINGREVLVEKKPGVVREPAPQRKTTPRMPDFDKKALAMFDGLYRDRGFVGTVAQKEARIAELRAKLKAAWEAEQAGRPAPMPSRDGGYSAEDVKGAIDYIQKNRLINSQINKNDRSNQGNR